MDEKKLTRIAFWAMVKRDLLVQWRDKGEFIFRVAMLPFILILVYGFMLPTVGILPATFPTHMFCGMIGMSMLIFYGMLLFRFLEIGNNFSVKKLFYYKVHNLYYLINGGIIQCFIVQL